MGFEDFGLSFTNPDFVQYANAYGATGHRVEAAIQFSSLAEQAFRSGGVHLIDVPMDYSENDRILNQEIKELSARL